jgi:cytochrome c biogenesis protein CcdA
MGTITVTYWELGILILAGGLIGAIGAMTMFLYRTRQLQATTLSEGHRKAKFQESKGWGPNSPW